MLWTLPAGAGAGSPVTSEDVAQLLSVMVVVL